MKRGRFVLGTSLVAIAAAMALSVSSAAFAASAPTPAAPKEIDLTKPFAQAKSLGTVKFLKTTSFSAVAKPLAGAETLAPSGSVNRPVPKGNRGAAPLAVSYPTVNSLGIVNAPSQVVAKTGLTGYDQRTYGGYSLEPPDTEICAGNGYVMQTVNNILGVYDGAGNALSPPMPAEYFFSDFTNNLFDPKCYWDPDTKHFFVTWAVSDFDTFSGVYIAVSQTGNPLAPWNIYFLDTTDPFGNTGCFGDSGVACLGDQPLLGADKWTLQISTNEFPLVGGFNGAEMFFIDKTALALGLPSPNLVGFDLGDTSTPDGACPTDSSGAPCWYSVQPAESPNGNYDLHGNGTSYSLSALDFFGANDNRIALWAWTNTKSISSVAPVINGVVSTLGTQAYGQPPFGVQAEGDHPLGESLGVTSVRDIQTNDDRMNEAEFNSRTGWLMGGLNTGANVHSSSNFRAAIAWFGFKLQRVGSSIVVVGQKGNYIANTNADVMFPASTTVNSGSGVWAYSLTGDALYPSSAFSTFGNSVNPSKIIVANKGVGPQDGFTEYSDIFFGSYRPRWGDYSGAVTDGDRMYWATEFIDQTCSLAEYSIDVTCGGERGRFINWANSLNSLTVSH